MVERKAQKKDFQLEFFSMFRGRVVLCSGAACIVYSGSEKDGHQDRPSKSGILNVGWLLLYTPE